MEINDQNLQRISDDEVDYADILRQIWAGRRIIFITLAIFIAIAIFSLIYRFNSATKEYESKATLFVETTPLDSIINGLKSPLFLSEILKTKLTGSKQGSTLTVAQFLTQQTTPPQGNLESLSNRINGTKGDAGILVITVMMQEQFIATQLTDSVVQKLVQFLKETQIKRAAKNKEMLAEDTTRNFQLLSESSARNILYLSKTTSINIQYLAEGIKKDIQFLNESSAKDIQFLTEGSTKDIQFLTEGYLKAESIYTQSQQALAEYYSRNNKKNGSIDSLEVKRLNSDIKLKYNVYSALYNQLETTKIDIKKQFEKIKINATKQLEQAKIKAEKEINQANIDAAKQHSQALLDAEKQLVQTRIDAVNQIERVTLDAEKKVPVINVLEPATVAVPINVIRVQRVVLLMVFFGLIAGIGIVFGKRFYDKNFAQWRSEKK